MRGGHGHPAPLIGIALEHMSGKTVEKVSFYKYLGLILDYSLDFNTTAKVLGDSGGRALGAVINKFISNHGLGFNTLNFTIPRFVLF